MRYRTLSALAALMNEITFFYNAFLFISFVNTRVIMRIDYWPWALGGAAILLWNRRFLLKARTLVSVIAANTLITSLWLFLGIRYFFHMHGLAAYGYAAVFLISTTIRAIYLSTHVVPDQRMVTYTEIGIIGTCFFFFIQLDPFIMPVSYNIPSLAVILFNILALINMRLYAENVRGLDISKLRGGLFIVAAFAIIAGGTVGILTFASASFRTFVIQVITTVKGIIALFFSFLHRLIDIIMMWLNPKAYSGNGIINYRIKVPKVNKQVLLNIDISRFMPWIFILLTLIVIVYLFIKYRERIFRRDAISVTIKQRQIKRELKLWSEFKSYMRVLYRKILLLYLSIHMRHTPQGLFLVIERWGRSKGFSRQICETPGTYLNRLMNCKAWNKGLKETQVIESVQHLIKELESRFYGNGKDFAHSRWISKAEIKLLRPYFYIGIRSRK